MERTPLLIRSPLKPESSLFDPSPVRKRGKLSNSGNKKPKAIDLNALNNEVIDKFNSTIHKYDGNNEENIDPQWSNTHSPTSTFSFSDENQSHVSNGSSNTEDSKTVIEQGIGNLNFECSEQDTNVSFFSALRFEPLSSQKTRPTSLFATYYEEMANINNDGGSVSDDDDCFRIPPLHLLRKDMSVDDSDENGKRCFDENERNYFEDRKENERKISIPPPIDNIFLQVEDEVSRTVGTKHKRSTDIWVRAFQERPRYMTDFEQEGIMGEGSFSTVFKSRNRLDGCLYAIKKLNRKITSASSKNVVLKEACALAALADCPRLIRYYGCWIEDSHLWIQTELCMRTTLDIFVSQQPKKVSSFKTMSNFSSTKFDSPDVSLLSTIDEVISAEEEDRCDPVVFLSCHEALDFRREDVKLGANVEITNKSPSPLHPSFTTPCSKTGNNYGNMSDGKGDELQLQFPEELGWIVAQQVSEALQFMHRKGVAHLDIRPSNIFIGSDEHTLLQEDMPSRKVASGLQYGTLQIKLGDLGMCCRVRDHDAAIEGESRYCAVELMDGVGNIPDHSVVASITKSSSFFEPSNCGKRQPGIDLSKADMFSLGASLYELCKGLPLPSDSGDVDSIADSEWHAIRNDRIPMGVLHGYSTAFQSLVVSLMSYDPALRPSASEVLLRCSIVKQKGISMVTTPSKLDESISSDSSTAYDALAQLKSDCLESSTISHIDTLRSVLNDHVGIISNINPPLSLSVNYSSSTVCSDRSADEVILDAASAIDRLVFELKNLRRDGKNKILGE